MAWTEFKRHRTGLSGEQDVVKMVRRNREFSEEWEALSV
jgi:hypothetical protein